MKKITEEESATFKAIHDQEDALIEALGKVKRRKNDLAKSLCRKYEIDTSIGVNINHKTREITELGSKKL